MRLSGRGSFCARGSSGLACVKYQVSASRSTSFQNRACEEITSPLRGSVTAGPIAFSRGLGVQRITE